ncbi:hypothetical protein NDU88_005396 [Pleurodeles waltl]|uniref:Uncharacterized protein n=1 Tax=Pleurodeles waltl TaxID=8319 RepID=A0AAV7NMN7_PLEWA|nr:hypothetical protein NDU88_005396 [Pleurodeles waltl]
MLKGNTPRPGRSESSKGRGRRRTRIAEERNETQRSAVGPKRTEGEQKEEATEEDATQSRGHSSRGGREGELRTRKPATFLEECGLSRYEDGQGREL